MMISVFLAYGSIRLLPTWSGPPAKLHFQTISKSKMRSALSLSSSPPGSPAGRGSPPPSNAPTTLPPSPNGRAFNPLSPPPNRSTASQSSPNAHSPLSLSAAKRDDAHPLSPSAVSHTASHPISPSSSSSTTVHASHPSRLHVLVSDAPIFPANVNLSVFSPTGEMSPTRNKFLDKHLTPPRSPSARTGSPSTFPSVFFVLFCVLPAVENCTTPLC
jgi:hypothetical protein